MRVLLVIILDVLLVPVTGRKQSQLLVLGLSLEFDNYGALLPLIHEIQLSFFFGLSYQFSSSIHGERLSNTLPAIVCDTNFGLSSSL